MEAPGALAIARVLRRHGHDVESRHGVVLDPAVDLAVLPCPGDGTAALAIRRERLNGGFQPIIVVGHSAPCPACDDALAAGADAWIPEPLVAVQLPRSALTLLRRAKGAWRSDTSTLELDPVEHSVRAGKVHVRLRPREFSLLAFLASEPNRWVSEQEILETAFGLHVRHSTGLVRVHVNALRKALQLLPPCIQSRRGLGYRFVPPDADDAVRGSYADGSRWGERKRERSRVDG